MNKPPSFSFYATDWNGSKAILLMKPIQHGYYINLMARAWDSPRAGTLPNDHDVLWKLARASSKREFEKDSALVLAQFKVLPGGKLLGHPRLMKERRSQLKFSRSQSLRGHMGGIAKHKKALASGAGQANATPESSQSLANSGSSSSSSFSSSSSLDSKDKPTAAPQPRISVDIPKHLQRPMQQVDLNTRSGKRHFDLLMEETRRLAAKKEMP